MGSKNRRLIEEIRVFNPRRTGFNHDKRVPTMEAATGGRTQIDDQYCMHNKIRSMCEICGTPDETRTEIQTSIMRR